MDELQAASLRIKLRHLDEWNTRRSKIAAVYLDGLKAEIVLPFVPDWASPVWHLFVIRHPQRDALQKKLTEAGIGTLIHYPVPPHRSGAYAKSEVRSQKSEARIAEQLASTVLSLPIGPHLSNEMTGKVIRAVNAAFADISQC
jgi:dTDP-4-amino-4,6-dideoxygalactose transaminase